jgi:methyltransferase (TIGR00027 family)
LSPSAAARWTAAQRVRVARTRPATPGADLDGERRLYDDVAGRAPVVPVGRVGDLRLRTRVVDAEVAAAIGRGIEQIVLLGAGYDGRALRFAAGAIRWFEVDTAAVQADKRGRMRALDLAPSGVIWVSADLETDDLGAALDAAGLDPARPSLFVCESALLGLPLAAAASLSETLRARAEPGSRFVATFAVAPDPTGSRRTLRTATSAATRVLGETRRDELRPGDPEKLMVVTGWHITHTELGHDHLLDRGAHQLMLVCVPRPPP